MLQSIGKIIRLNTLSEDARNICMASLSSATHSQYNHHMKDFEEYCESVGVDNHLCISVTTGVEFLTSLFNKNRSYSTINAARSALSQHVVLTDSPNVDFGKHALVAKFMKGVFKLNPPTSRYKSTWDVSIVLDKLGKIANNSCSLKELSMKCTMLTALATGQRVQTLNALSLDELIKDNNRFVFNINKILKTTRPGDNNCVEICRFAEDSTICPYTTLEVYIDRTSRLRGHRSRLFLSFVKPHNPVSNQSMSRWLSETLKFAGINELFKAHSTRAAASSKAALHTDINTVLNTVGWKSESTFAKFYRKPIVGNSFVNAVFAK